ncbi:unnamed protein product, partial [marine sediment metagenome]
MHMGIMEIMTGFSKCVLSTGVEHMTRVSMQNTHITPNLKIIDKKSEWYRPRQDFMVTSNMLQTAQKLYEQEIPAFTKEDMDKIGVRAHNLTVKN